MKTFYQAIYEWVEQNFGSHETQDPSWDIETLAEHLSESDIDPDELNAMTKNRVYDTMREHFLEEDIEQVAESKGLTLTTEQVARIKHQYCKMDDETWEQLSVIMDNIIMERGE